MSRNRGIVYTKPGEVQVQDIADPKFENPQGRKIEHGVILKVVSTNICVPTTAGRELLLTRYTQPEPELRLLIQQLKLQLPPQPPPRIATGSVPRHLL
jgi:hypothetical protein